MSLPDLSKLDDASLEALRAKLQQEKDDKYADLGMVCREQEHRLRSVKLAGLVAGLPEADRARLLGTVKK